MENSSYSNQNQFEPQLVSITSKKETKANHAGIWLIVIFVLFLTAGIILFLSFRQSAKNTPSQKAEINDSTGNSQINKSIITVAISALRTNFISTDQITYKEKTFFSVDRTTSINEAGVSPNGKSIYFVPFKGMDYPNKVRILNNDGSEQDIFSSDSSSLHLSNPGIMNGGVNKNFSTKPVLSQAAPLIQPFMLLT